MPKTRTPSPESVSSPRLQELQRAPQPRLWVLLWVLMAGLWAAYELRLDPRDLIPGSGGLTIAQEFFGRALSPALDYESENVPAGTPPLLWKALEAARQTVIFAVAAMSLAILLGLPLGCLASQAWWRAMGSESARPSRRWLFVGIRVLIAVMRSIHELLWAVLFLAAFGLSHFSAVVAIAIPFAGILAKVFSEMIDEAPEDAAEALAGSGAGEVQVFLFALLPRALPDMGAYAFYRFECALRSSAVLGFFGFPTLGYYISASFENLYYGEVWTYLYTVFLLVMVADLWSGALRRSLLGTAK